MDSIEYWQVFALVRGLVALTSGDAQGIFFNDFNPSPGLIGLTSGVCPVGDVSKRNGNAIP